MGTIPTQASEHPSPPHPFSPKMTEGHRMLPNAGNGAQRIRGNATQGYFVPKCDCFRPPREILKGVLTNRWKQKGPYHMVTQARDPQQGI